MKQSPILIGGPCVIENRSLVIKTAKFIKDLSQKIGIDIIFKSSFDKANRTSIDSFRGVGIKSGLMILLLNDAENI
jgi:2-dehydro-3-deoxyphosphooctonate aldolase (KDO 8-P synthase)